MKSVVTYVNSMSKIVAFMLILFGFLMGCVKVFVDLWLKS